VSLTPPHAARNDAAGHRNGSTPTVLLVHGGFSDASIWSRVISDLAPSGIDVMAPANPLRGLEADAACIAAVAAALDCPVILAGHGYGGAVVTVAGGAAPNVVGLVYVAGYALDAGESCLDIDGRFASSGLPAALRPATYRNAGGRLAVELYLAADAFQDVLAADVPAAVTHVCALAQRPIAAAALEEPAPAAAWRSVPSWYVVAAADRAVAPEAQRFMARRAACQATEVHASHAVTLSQPEAVGSVIRAAVLSRRPVAGR
jgi:pimeloyl-ACP methyl ester carboxylesterase